MVENDPAEGEQVRVASEQQVAAPSSSSPTPPKLQDANCLLPDRQPGETCYATDTAHREQALVAQASEAQLPSSSPSLHHSAAEPASASPLGSLRQPAGRTAAAQDPQAWMGHTLAAHSLDRGRGNYAGFQQPVLEQGHRHALTVDLPASASFHIGTC